MVGVQLLIAPSALDGLDAWIAASAAVADRSPPRASVVWDGSVRADGVVVVRVQGPLSKSLDYWQTFFGEEGTTYGAVAAALEAAELDRRVASVDLVIDSPGGSVDGLFECVQRMNALEKPRRAVVSDMAASAAYAIAAQCDSIVATNRGARVGSIGVATSVWVSSSAVDIASTDAPAKRPDARTEEGRAVIRAELDAIHRELVSVIADGRGVDAATVNASYGRGAVLVASDAQAAGMIDAILPAPARPVTPTSMQSLDDLKAQHPSLYTAALALGAQHERERCVAHVVLGRASGAFEPAFAAIEGGELVTETIKAQHVAASIARQTAASRVGDNPPAVGHNATGGTAASAGDDLVASVYGEIARKEQRK